MHVDGFRFDLASALARERDEFDPRAPFLGAIQQDPVLSRVKLIAEPWDLGDGGYQVANFPAGWAEWNDKYRDTVRRFWRGDAGQLPELGYRLTGSSDLYELGGRGPRASVNFVTAHDGFTLADLVSYERKHNGANGEGNRDGSDHNWSWNGGVEGPSADPAIVAVRERRMRNFLATLLLSQGTPMLCGGDEIARTQGGNNNAYCQDNAVSWLDWLLPPAAVRQRDFTRRLVRLRAEHPVFHRRAFFEGRRRPGAAGKDLTWIRADGKEMAPEDWASPHRHCIGMRLAGDALVEVGDDGERVVDDTFLVLLNAGAEQRDFVLPANVSHAGWQLVLDTRAWETDERGPVRRAGDAYALEGRSLAVFRLREHA
jgi:glycogen operon protein